MPLVEVSSVVPQPRESVFAWHLRPGALERMTPPWTGARVIEAPPPRVGAESLARLRGQTIRAVHTAVEVPTRFADEGRAGPMRFTHEHRFEDARGGGTRVTDRVEYSPALPTVRALLERSLAWRQARLALDLERHARFRDRPRLRVGVTGATGFLGRELCAFLSTGGHEVVPLARRGAKAQPSWDPATGELHDVGHLDALLHLAGEPLVGGRWTAAKKKRIHESRGPATRKLCERLASSADPPKTLVCASAIGYYGDRGEETLDESSPPGEGFMAGVCREWEEACEPARAAGIRLANLRTSIVLSPNGGALVKLLPPARLGVGGPLGSGDQWMSFVSREDWVGVAHHVLMTDLQGPVVVTAPEPLRNRDFARTLGHVLRRPAFVPAPAFALRAALGELADEGLLLSQKVVPTGLTKSGFTFAHPTVEAMLRWELGLPSAPLREA